MMNFARALIVMTAAMASASSAYATPMLFGGTLSGANEIPPVPSTAMGSVTVVLDPTAQTIEIKAAFSGLGSNDTAAHIHCCAPLGTNVGVATRVPAFMGFPLGVTSGTYDQVFSLTDSTFYNTAFVTTHGGTVAGAEAALEAGIESQMAYFNIHTTNFPGGEIRSQLFGVPEPASSVLLATALLGVALGRRRQRSSTP